MQPYSKGLKDFIRSNPDFATALKINNPNRFISVGAVVISHSPLVPEDKIIGFFVYDNKEEKFKQDIIVDIQGKDKEFILYTRFRSRSKWIKDINEFINKYGQGLYYSGFHWLKFDELPDEIKPNTVMALELAKLKDLETRELTETELEKFDKDLKELGL